MSTSNTTSFLLHHHQQQQQQQDVDHLYKTCILGSHILHYHGVLDAYGHLSFRHPSKPDIFVMPRNMAPANITSPKDLVAYKVSDATPLEANAPAGYIERHIHSEIYKQYPAINSVIHSHATAVVPYTITGVPLKPCIHMAGFLGASTPVYDVAQYYQPNDTRDLLIRTTDLGKSLASCFSHGGSDSNEPGHSVVLMRGHGYTVVASKIEDCVFRAIYTKENALIQTASLGLIMAYHKTGDTNSEFQALRDDEIGGTTSMSQISGGRAWGLWTREVEAADFYTMETMR